MVDIISQIDVCTVLKNFSNYVIWCIHTANIKSIRMNSFDWCCMFYFEICRQTSAQWVAVKRKTFPMKCMRFALLRANKCAPTFNFLWVEKRTKSAWHLILNFECGIFIDTTLDCECKLNGLYLRFFYQIFPTLLLLLLP